MYTTHIRFERHYAYTYIHMRYLGTCRICPSTSKRAFYPMVLVEVMPDHDHACERPSRASLRSIRSTWPTGGARTTLARHAGTTWGLRAQRCTWGRRQLEEEGDLDPRDDSGDGGATCRRCTRSKATFKDSKTFVGERGHVVVTAPAQELTRRARQQSARWKCSGRGQEAGMLGPRGENPRASTAEVRGARTIMRASTQESAFARVSRAAPSALSNELFHDRTRG